MKLRALLPRFGPRIEGFVDRVIASEIVGWAYDPARPEGRVLVVARRRGEVVAETLADLPRRDLAEKGDGRHGFRLRVPPSLEDGGRHHLTVEAQVGQRRIRLQHGVLTFVADTGGRPAGRAAHAANGEAKQQPPAGFLERVSDGVLRGWAVNPYDPEPPAALDVFDDEVFLGATIADIARPKLQQTGAPAGARGFQFDLPKDVDAVAIDRLRVRVAGTYLDLRRSKTYPGDGAGAPFDAPADLDQPRARRALTPPPPPPPQTVALLICGAGEGIGPTLQSWAAQKGAETLCALVEAKPAQDLGAAVPQGVKLRRFGPGEDAKLRAFLTGVDSVVLAAPGETLDAELAATLLRTARMAEVVTWEAAGLAPRPAEPDLALLLGESLNGGFAVRGHVFDGCADGFARDLAAGRLRSLELWLAADPGLRWDSLGTCFSTHASASAPLEERFKAPAGFSVARSSGMGPLLTPLLTPDLVSLAVWSGWGETPPPALGPLLAGSTGLHVEVLLPSGPQGGAMEAKVRDLAGRKGPASLHFRQVETPAGASPASLWRRLGQAASGEAVVFCHGDVRLTDPACLPEILAWSLEPRVGAVSVEIVAEGSAAFLAGLRLELDASEPSAGSAFDPAFAGRARPVVAAPAAFLAVSRSALALAGGFDAAGFPGGLADLDLGLRLAQVERHSVLLGHLRVTASKDTPGFGPAEPLTPALAALLSRRLDGAVARKAAA